MSPEQIRGGRIDARADVYALGGVLHYALTGRVPFEREGDEAKLWAQLSGATAGAVATSGRDCRAQFDVVVVRAMAQVRRTIGIPSAGDLGRAAQAAAVGRSPTEPERMVARGAAAPGAAPTEPGLAAEASTRTAARFPGKRRRRRRAPLVAAGALLVAVGAVAAVPSMRDDDGPGAAGGATPAPTASPRRTPSPTPTREALPRRRRDDRQRRGAPGRDRARGRRPLDHQRSRAAADAGRRGDRSQALPAPAGRARRRHDRRVPRRPLGRPSGRARAVLHLDGRTGEVRRRIPVAIVPRRLAVTRHGVWVANSAPGGILRYDRDNGALLQTIPVPDGVRGMIAGGDAIWVVTHANNKLARLEPGATRVRDWTNLPGAVRSMRFATATPSGSCSTARTRSSASMRRNRASHGVAPAGQGPAQAVYAGGRVYVSQPRRQHRGRARPQEPPARRGPDPGRLQPRCDGRRRPLGVGRRARRQLADADRLPLKTG